MSKPKLLLADDSVTIQKVVNLTFADEGIDVVAVGDGDTAMERFAEDRPDIVLADVNMPGLTGYEISDRIRSSDETRDIPVILLVGSFETFDQVRAAEVGATGHLTKPFQSIRELVSMVTDLITAPKLRIEEPASPETAEGESSDARETEPAEVADIDDLYQESISDTDDLGDAETVSARFGDAGMDDEMIETSYPDQQTTDEYDDLNIAEGPQPADEISFEPDVQAESIYEVDSAGEAETAELEDVTEFVSNQPADETDGVEYEAEQAAEHEQQAEPLPAARLETLDDLIEEDDGAEDETDFAIDDLNLLELPTTRPSVPAAPVQAVEEPEPIAPIAAAPPAETAEPEAAHEPEAAAGAAPTPEISQELVDAVAKRVMEQISERVIREIAWKVVPEVVIEAASEHRQKD